MRRVDVLAYVPLYISSPCLPSYLLACPPYFLLVDRLLCFLPSYPPSCCFSHASFCWCCCFSSSYFCSSPVSLSC